MGTEKSVKMTKLGLVKDSKNDILLGFSSFPSRYLSTHNSLILLRTITAAKIKVRKGKNDRGNGVGKRSGRESFNAKTGTQMQVTIV